MNEPDQDLQRTFKSEADDLLFEGLHFDSRMMDRVMSHVHPPRRRSAVKERFGMRLRKWGFPAAAAVVVIFASVSQFHAQDPGIVSPDQREPIGGNQPATFVGDANPLMAKDQVWKLQTPEEAETWFGSGLLAPSYAPERYKLKEIRAYGPEKGKAAQIVFQYADNLSTYLITEDKKAPAMDWSHYDPIRVNGEQGYVHWDQESGQTELHWFAGGIHYQIAGTLTQEEAVRIAEALQK